MLLEETYEGYPLVIYYDETPHDYSSAQFTRKETAALDNVNRRVANTDSLEDITDFLLSSAREITKTDRLCLAFLEEEGMRAFSKVVRTTYTPVLLKEGYSQDIRQGSLLRVIEQGYPRVISNLAAYAKLHPESGSSALLAKEGVRSSMTCPLMVNDRMIGLLFRNSKEASAYGKHEVMLHLSTAERISQTVEKAYRIRELEEANRNYTEMLAFVSHELKSPIGSLVMDSNLLIEGYLGEVNEKQRAKLQTMVDKGEYLLNMVEDYLNLNKIENTDLKLDLRSDIDFSDDILSPALNITMTHAEAKNIRIETDIADTLKPLPCDPDLIRIVMVNLLSNAVKYGFDNGLVKITAGESQKGVMIAVYNTGPGFPESAKSRLFRKFSRIKTPELMARKGTGVGLYTVWRIISLHGGSVNAESEEGSWALFTFILPRTTT